jgi:hypothetical protein
MNPIWRYLVICEIRKQDSPNLDTRLNIPKFYRLRNFALRKWGKNYLFPTIPNTEPVYEVRVPENFQCLKWVITPEQRKRVHNISEVGKAQNEIQVMFDHLDKMESQETQIKFLYDNFVILNYINSNNSRNLLTKLGAQAIIIAAHMKNFALV